MYLSSISILFFAIIMMISTSAMPSPFIYQTDDGQVYSNIDDTEIQHVMKREQNFASWLPKRNSPLCDYRLQFRPLPLVSTLCAYG